MTTPTYIPCSDATALRAAIAPWLAVDPVPFALICGIVERIGGGGGWGGVIHVGGVPRVALVQTPPHAVLIATPGPVDPACLECAVGLLRARTGTVHGVNGPNPWAEAVAASLGVTVCARLGVRLHRLVGAPRLPRPVAGRMRAFQPDDDELLWRWNQAFWLEVEPAGPGPLRNPTAMALLRGESFAWAVDGQPVSMARLRRPLLGGWSIGGVYTPPELRGRGYAGAVVQALSARLVAEGASYVALYTDLANPISNHLYARIGFVPCLDQTRLTWNPP
jgi:RimJ/RimL family protein N-acetyltransferase